VAANDSQALPSGISFGADRTGKTFPGGMSRRRGRRARLISSKTYFREKVGVSSEMHTGEEFRLIHALGLCLLFLRRSRPDSRAGAEIKVHG